MFPTYQGLIRDGKPMLFEAVVLPENARIIITVLHEMTAPNVKTKAQEQNEALKRLIAGLTSIDDEPFDEEFDSLMSQRFNITRELDI